MVCVQNVRMEVVGQLQLQGTRIGGVMLPSYWKILWLLLLSLCIFLSIGNVLVIYHVTSGPGSVRYDTSGISGKATFLDNRSNHILIHKRNKPQHQNRGSGFIFEKSGVKDTYEHPSCIYKPSCMKLIEGNKEDILMSKLHAVVYPYKRNRDYITETKNCTVFVARSGYIMDVTKEEAAFPLAFSIVMYKDVEQTERLLRAIYRPTNHYCVHVDHDSDVHVKKAMENIVKCLPNVFMASQQIHVEWGKFSVIQTELICMADLLKIRGWKYFINLTGQEFPLKTNLQIVDILKIMNGTNNVDANNQTQWKRLRWKKAWPPPFKITPYKGNIHALLSRDFVNYTINDVRARNFTHWLKSTRVPDETLFSSLDNNPSLQVPGSSAVQVNTDYDLKPYIARFKNWGTKWGERSFDWPCHGKRVRHVCVFGTGDLPLLTSRRELFANKFHIDYEPQTFDCIEEWHRNMTEMEYLGIYKMDYSFYRNMPQLKHKSLE